MDLEDVRFITALRCYYLAGRPGLPWRDFSQFSTVDSYHHGVPEISSRPSGFGAWSRFTYARNVAGAMFARAATLATLSLTRFATGA